jgi:DNA-binding CsgD family transcriptional regulator
MTREEAIDIRQRSLNRQPVSMAELDEAMKVIKSPEPGIRERRWNNPWDLPPQQCNTLDSVIAHFGEKGAAAAMGVSHRTVSEYLRRAREKMQARTRLHAVLMWDRHMQQCINAQMNAPA